MSAPGDWEPASELATRIADGLRTPEQHGRCTPPGGPLPLGGCYLALLTSDDIQEILNLADAAQIPDARREVFVLRQQRRAAFALHRPVANGMGVLHCSTCQVDAHTAAGMAIGDSLPWPCPTARALGVAEKENQ